MKIDIVSDVHLDAWQRFYGDNRFMLGDRFVPNKDSSVCVMAGDVGNDWMWYSNFVEYLSERYEHVVAVPGNHDFYDLNFHKTKVLAQSSYDSDARRNIWLTEEDPSLKTVEIDGVKFVCATLWTNFWGAPEVHGRQCMEWLNDFKYIPEVVSADNPVETMAGWYQRSRDFLMKNADADVVVTHFAPSVQSIHPQYAGNELNPYFCNDDEALVNFVSPKIWVHGHTHNSMDYRINNTRVLCSPVGYPRENINSLRIRPKQVEIQ